MIAHNNLKKRRKVQVFPLGELAGTTMDDRKDRDRTYLRKRAENLLKKTAEDIKNIDPGDIKELFHELEVHRIELELQNAELQNAQKELYNAMDQYSFLYNSAPVGYLLLDGSGIILQYNETFRKMVEREDLEFKRMSFADLLPEVYAKVFRSRYRIFFQKPENKSIELKLDSTQQERFIQLEAKKLDNRLTHPFSFKSDALFVTVTDITDRKKALKETENLANILIQSTDSIVLTNTDGNIEYVNPMFEKVTGYRLEEVKGKNPRILKADTVPYDADYYKEMWNTLKQKKVWTGEFVNQKKNGEIFIEEASIFPFRDPDTGEIGGYGTVKKDVTESRRLEKELKQSYHEVVQLKDRAEAANRMKSKFLANMSHEIRTPINAVLGFTDLLMKNETRSQSIQYLNKIKHAGDGLLNLISDILDFSKIEADQLDIYLETFSLNDLIGTLESIFDIQFRSKNIPLRIEKKPNLPKLVHHDKWRINQVLSNLLSNALKFTPSGEVILSVSHQSDQDRLIFFVKDTGIGIGEEQIKRIFDPFTQLEEEPISANTGVGLGLAICKKLVQLMEGAISVSSELGKGTVFKVEIPVNSKQVVHYENYIKRTKTKEIELAACKKEGSILIAEDNAVNMELIIEQLKDSGLSRLLTAVNGQEAVRIALEQKPDLILMDIQMPVMDGNTAISILKERELEIPIIALSAYAMPEDIEKTLKIGAVDYITKPIDFDILLKKISTYLDIKGPSESDEQDTENQEKAQDNIIIKSSVSARIRSIFLRDLTKKRDELSDILDGAMSDKKLGALETIAHGYQGNAAYFGLTTLLNISAKLEQMIQDEKEESEILQLSRNLLDHLDKIDAANREEETVN